MCGISLSKINFNLKENNLTDILLKVESNIKQKNLTKALFHLKELKCNNFFINILENKKNKTIFENILNEFKKKINSEKLTIQKNIDLKNDINWVIDSELIFKSKRILEFLVSNKIKKNRNSIIFTKYLLYTLETMNYLESRGRDSLGLTINIINKKKINIKKNTLNNSELTFYQKKINRNKFLISITLKFAKRIGYSGENVSNILKIIKNKKIFDKFNFLDLLEADFISHTRWASVGEVNLSNTHPIIDSNKDEMNMTIMNGDILNHKKIYESLKKDKKYTIKDKKCTNDLKSISSLIFNTKKKLIKYLEGSFVLINYNTKKPYQLKIYKKGSQGLYYTLDNDGNIHFASDVYGLINKSNNFQKLNDDGEYQIDWKFVKKLKLEQSKSTDLMTNDLSKKGFDKFFLKEINDTETFIKRTIFQYISQEKKIIQNLDNVFNKKTIDKLKKGKIRNIILTGMGSCYTAAVGISKYLNSNLAEMRNNKMKIKATVASEGSGFYLSNNMSDTIIIIIAQSGTTIDTNVFAKMAKERGAYTLSIVNKKQGDITYIVDQNIYLGNGRDVEMSVPSTKTYTCHLIMGCILSEKIKSLISNKKNDDFINENINLYKSSTIQNSFIFLKDYIEELKFKILKYQKWIVIHDDSHNSFAALELRIKLSECCYKSIPYMHIDNIDFKKYKNTLFIYQGENKILKKNLIDGNYYIWISYYPSKINYKNKFEIILKNKKDLMIIVENSFILQLLSYKLSKLIDNYSSQLKKKIDLKKFNLIKEFFIDRYELERFSKLSVNSQKKNLVEKSKRPIDAIKHQAKTVTVGATRIARSNVMHDKINFFSKDINLDNINFKNLLKHSKNSINIVGSSKTEIEKYFLGNIIDTYNKRYFKNIFYNIYNKNSDTVNHKNNSTKIILSNKKINFSNNNKFYSFKFSNYHEFLKIFLPNDNIFKMNDIEFQSSKIKMFRSREKLNFNLDYLIKNFHNIKFLGSGINYLVAKKFATKLNNLVGSNISFDIIENHKHIDISSEATLVIFAANIYRSGFQNDVYSEIEKFIAHNNKTVIITNEGNNIYDSIIGKENFIKNRLIKLPRVSEIYSLPIFDYYFNEILIKNF